MRMMSTSKDKGKGGTVGILIVLIVLVILGIGAAIILKRSMDNRSVPPVETTQKERVVEPATRLVEAPPPLPEEPPRVEEEEVVVEEAPAPSTKVKKKALPNGTIDKSAAQSVTKKNFARVRACYEKQLKVNNLLQGNLTVRIVVYPDGSVNSVNFTQDTIRNQAMNSCIKNEIMGWTFPKPDGGKAEVHVPYRFEPKAG
jgi:cytoskeletal protein RodZ